MLNGIETKIDVTNDTLDDANGATYLLNEVENMTIRADRLLNTFNTMKNDALIDQIVMNIEFEKKLYGLGMLSDDKRKEFFNRYQEYD